ncbi:type VI secretion system tip protein VgrG [Citrobacter sp. Cs237]|uniref:type VI secretion system Vgr family protein n=1 Tax=Citrobacter TaxID=544 RepID=UPI0025788E57|nr:type VI secretion system tip protein TssI/VgrG [Citrobacter sp. Cs237]MDM2750488.1 type VI secretion system tip protein VgrG [Citrobacter sp. Cs237]HBU8852646.1 type VI secretion system tip protein VgrG [Citrobacter sedlakii]
MPIKGLRFTLAVDGLPEMTTAVVSFRLTQHYSKPFQLKVDIASGLSDLTAIDFLEKKAVLTIWQGMEPQRYISGIVSAVTLSENNHWQMGYHIIISPPLWRSGLRQNFRIFQQQDIKAISSTLLTENGITEWTPVFYESHPAREFCVQYGETDLAFLTRLWSEEGIFYFDWNAPQGPEQKLVLCDDVAGVSSLGGMPFNPNTTAEASTEHISQFRYHAQIRPSSVEIQDYTFKMPAWPGYYSRAGENLNGQLTQYEIFDYPGRFKDESHGQNFARYQIEGRRHNAETATGYSNSPKMWPGKRFTLTGHPSVSLNREWQIVSSVLAGDQPQALHGSQGTGTTLSNRFEVIPADRTWRVPPLPKPSVDGPQSAIVTGPAGEEIFCDEHGRVRVRFHWDRYCPGNEDSSCWVRVSQAWAGTGFGNLAIPRVGQEVIVDFLNGDPDQPIIMGRTYHQDNRSPGSLPGTKTQMTIRSKTYKGSGFNELRFDDATNNEEIFLHAQKNMQVKVLNSKDVRVNYDRTVSIGHDESLVVANDRKVTVEGKQDHKTTKDHITLVEGNYGLEVKGDLAQKISGALGISVQGDIVLQSDSKISLRVGSSFVVIHAGGVDVMGTKINLNGGGTPGEVILPMRPMILKAAAGNGTVFVSHCPKEDSN